MLSSESESSQDEGDSAEEDDNAKEDKGGIETSSNRQVASDGEEWQECPHTQDTLTGVSQVFGKHEDTDPELDPGEKVQSIQQKWCPKSPKEDSPLKDSSESSSSEEEPPTGEALCDRASQKAWLLDTPFDAWRHNIIANGIVGWATRDTMICDLLKHRKMQPNHPDPVGLPLGYMGECWVFDSIRSDIYDLCHFYTLGMTGNPPEFPTPQELVTHSQVRDLLKLAHSIGGPYLILAHSAYSVTAISMLWELHTTACLWCPQVDLRDKSIKLLFCPFCTYVGGGGNNLSYLNHIIIVHYNASYGCGKCLKQAFVSSSTLHNHKKVCLRFTKKPATGLTASPAAAEEVMAAMVAPPGLHSRRRTPRLLLQTPRAPVPKLPHRHCHATVNERSPATTRTQRRTHQVTRRKRRRRMQAPPGRAPVTRCTRTAADSRPASTPVPLFHQHPCIFSIDYFVLKLVCLL